MSLIYLSCAWIAGIFLGSLVYLPLSIILTSLIPLPLLFLFRQRRKPIILASLCLIAFFGGSIYSQSTLPPSDEHSLQFYNNQGTVTIKGVISTDPEIREKTTHLRFSASEIRSDRDWQEVSKDYFERYLPFLGMTIYVKQEGKGKDAAGPPGYEYVNNPRYGRWDTDSSGRSFWVFYGQYRLLSDFLGPGPLYRNYYDSYYSHRSRGVPYYGPHREYGTNGSYTKRSNPNFYSRRQSQKLAKEASFSKRVNQRIGRTKTSARGRGGSAGK